jgi:uncharacterized protein
VNLHVELSTFELADLSAALERVTEGKGLSVFGLDGFLSAIAIGPRMVLPSEWLPWVWDEAEGTAEPRFESLGEAKAVTGLLLRHNHAVEDRLSDDYVAEFEPLFVAGDEKGESAWCTGFLLGMRFGGEAARKLMVAEPLWFGPLLIAARRDEAKAHVTEADFEGARKALISTVRVIREHFRSLRRHDSQQEPEDSFSLSGPEFLSALGLEFDLDEAELDELGERLRAATAGLAMNLSTLEGFCAALLVGPALVGPSRWLPWVWDCKEGKAEPHFTDLAEFQKVSGLVMRFYNSVATRLEDRVIEFYEPLFAAGSAADAARWCAGFVCGMDFDPDEWTRRIHAEPAWFSPILLPIVSQEDGEELTDEDLAIFDDRLPDSLAKIRDYWRRHPRPPIGSNLARLPFDSNFPQPRRTGTKVGRNELCPCGSGKKYKKCCGVN